jgi:hexosaminidase
MKIFFALVILSIVLRPVVDAAEYLIIPRPEKLTPAKGYFTVASTTHILVDRNAPDYRRVGELLNSHLEQSLGYTLQTVFSSHYTKTAGLKNAIFLAVSHEGAAANPEGYTLDVSPQRIVISASTGAGMFYGLQSLLQLMPVDLMSIKNPAVLACKIPACAIEDFPRFPWRGMHLDAGRHFFSKDFVKKYIDLMALYKLNTFHWHLTEDQGWRIEIKKYPKLTTIGSQRAETMGDGTPYGGFYTQEDIKEVVAFAAQRHITIIPEIEMPGHSLAALAAYPEYSCTGGPFKVGTKWGVEEDVYCAGNDKTFDFLEDVLTEVMALFPGDVIHIGGDEVPKDRWKVCPKCQARIKAEGLKDEAELQSYFIRRIEKFINSKGKRIIGWDEILEGGLAPNADVMSWRGTDGGIAAAKANHDVVMTPGDYCYFDHYQGKYGEPKAIGGYLPIDTIYAYEPVPASLSAEEAKHILGAQGNMWTEYMPNEKHVEYMLMPRMLALAEMTWSQKERKDFPDFMKRVEHHYDLLTALDVNFRVPPPVGFGGRRVIFGDTTVELEKPVLHSTIRYTLDGTEPEAFSREYKAPIALSNGGTITARTFLPSQRSSPAVPTEFMRVDPKINGLNYSYYEGTWTALPDFAALTPVKKGWIYDLDLDAIVHRAENYGLKLEGGLMIKNEGDYTFTLSSDDGSRLILDGKTVVNNDSLHDDAPVSARIHLTAGKHACTVLFFQAGGDQALRVEIEGGGMKKDFVPAWAWVRE